MRRCRNCFGCLMTLMIIALLLALSLYVSFPALLEYIRQLATTG